MQATGGGSRRGLHLPTVPSRAGRAEKQMNGVCSSTDVGSRSCCTFGGLRQPQLVPRKPTHQQTLPMTSVRNPLRPSPPHCSGLGRRCFAIRPAPVLRPVLHGLREARLELPAQRAADRPGQVRQQRAQEHIHEAQLRGGHHHRAPVAEGRHRQAQLRLRITLEPKQRADQHRLALKPGKLS